MNNNIQTINSNPDILWGVLERELEDQDSEERSRRRSRTPIDSRDSEERSRRRSRTRIDSHDPRLRSDSRNPRTRSDSEELTPKIISKKLTPLIKSECLTQHKYKDPNLGQTDGPGLSKSKIEVACE